MDRLGLSLGSLFRRCEYQLSLKTVCMCGIQMLCRLEYMHQRSFIHRDIKPDNFVFGYGKTSGLLHAIDLGLAKKYRDMVTHVHTNYAEDKGIAGTARYVSINVHLGVEQSRRDDLESVGYVLIALLKGTLPWQGLEDDSGGDDKYEKISQCKMDTTLKVLCEDIPQEFLAYMQKVRDLRFDENPPYSYLRGLFIALMVKQNYTFDYIYDWDEARGKRIREALNGNTKAAGAPMNLSKIHVAKNTQKNSLRYLQPLPLFGAMSEAAAFVGRSKQHYVGGDLGNNLKFPEKLEMFLMEQDNPDQDQMKVLNDFDI